MVKKLFEKYKYPFIFAIFLAIVFISILNYNNTRDIIKDKFINKQKMVEQNILKTISHVNDAYLIGEDKLNSEMKKYSLYMREKYRENPNIEEWDLKKLQEKFNNYYDIYIINSDLKVVKTTVKKDIGLDFKKFTGFAEVLKKRLNGDEFVADRIDLTINTGEMKKFSYIPTYDNKYLLELGVNINDRFPQLQKLDIFSSAAQLSQEYDIVEEISFYKYNPANQDVGKFNINKKPYIKRDIDNSKKDFVQQAYLSDQIKINKYERGRITYTSKYFPALLTQKNTTDSWWNSYVVNIVYNNQNMLSEINQERSYFLLNTSIMLILFLIFIAVVSYLLKKFEYQSYHDKLTDLPNRKFFEEEFKKLSEIAQKNKREMAVIFLDIDNFKEVNDNFGHDIGDRMLKEVADRLKDNLHKKDILSRLGGDEFIMVIPDITSRDQIINYLEKILDDFKKPLTIKNGEFYISISLGVSIFPSDGDNLEDLLKKADNAMYKAKQEQKDFIIFNNNKFIGD